MIGFIYLGDLVVAMDTAPKRFKRDSVEHDMPDLTGTPGFNA